MIDDTLKNTETRMQKSIDALSRDLAGIRTGRASAALVDHLMVSYYDTPTPLNQIATIATPEPRLITIQAWDKQAVGNIEKAILTSGLGLNPSNDGTLIRVPIPLLTQERRQELAKLVKKRTEEAKVSVRNVRRDGVEELKSSEKEKEISQDEQKRAQEKIQAITDSFVSQADKLSAQKEAELMEV